MALFKGTPTYFGEGAVPCHRRDRGGLRDWFMRLLGFPQTPRYQPAGRALIDEPADMYGPPPPSTSDT